MAFTYNDIFGNNEIKNDTAFIKQVLAQPYEYWLGGSGDSSIEINNEERLIFLKTNQGIFIMHHPDYIAPITIQKPNQYYEHYIGGQAMKIPSICLCDEDTAYHILKFYVTTNGILTEEFQWEDIYSFAE